MEHIKIWIHVLLSWLAVALAWLVVAMRWLGEWYTTIAAVASLFAICFTAWQWRIAYRKEHKRKNERFY